MTKKGFTLIELTVVIAIIGILAMFGLSFDFNKKTDIEKRDRFNQRISSMIHSTILNMSSGKGIKSGTGIINPSDTHIRFSTGSIEVHYYSGATVIGTWEILNSPFFGESGYVITGIYWKNKDLVTTGSISSAEIIFKNNNDIVFSGSSSQSGVIIGMDAGYHAMKKTLEFDRRFGKITIK